ncbi:MAG: helix-turn-helix transcriptional regulator [Candidatus Brocadiaceae bacterium]|nr:helix-turn-helix transcriptional regulator [Candidatus Brocadiaceae bacterium]
MRTKTKKLQTFGTNVRHIREALCISQEKLAHYAGLHRTYIGGIERGERNPGLINIVKLAQALQVEPFELLKGVK